MTLTRLAAALALGAAVLTGFGTRTAEASYYGDRYGYHAGPPRYAPPPRAWYGHRHWHRPPPPYYGHHHGPYRYSGPPPGGYGAYR